MAAEAYAISEKHKDRSYTDYVLVTAGTSDWLHNVMKFAPVGAQGTAVDPRQFKQPVKLNRRDERAIRDPQQSLVDKVKDDVEMEETSENGKEKRDDSLIAPRALKDADASNNRRGFFQKKTRRIFQTDASLAARKLAAIESHPWLLEDRTSERWVGRLEGGLAGHGGIQDGGTGGTSVTGGGNNALFVIGTDPTKPSMTVIPAAKAYKFIPAPLETQADADEAENEFARRSKGKYEDRWAVRNKRIESAVKDDPDAVKREDGAPTRKNGLTVKREPAGPSSADRRSRTFNAVHAERPSARYADASEESQRHKQAGDTQDFDEFDFDAEFQDDEEGAGRYGDDVLDDEDVKQLEERMKRDMQGGNHLAGDQEPARQDDKGNLFSEDEDDRQLDAEGKAAKKLFKKLQKQKRKDEGLASDESSGDEDDENKRNPYASDSESQTDSSQSKSSKDKPKDSKTSTVPSHLKQSASGSQTPSLKQSTSNKKQGRTSLPPSRGQSPTPGSALLVSRATATPRRSSGSRAGSPRESRAGSPLAGTPVASTSGVKRKAEGGAAGAEKKTRTAGPSAAELDSLITRNFLEDFFRDCPTPEDATARRFLTFVKDKTKVNPRADGVMDFLKAFLQKNCVNTNGVLAMKA